MTDYKATPEQWEHVHICAGMKHQVPWATADCLLELRDRIQLLEDAVHKHIVETSANILALASRVEALESVKRPASKVHEISEPLKLTPEQAQQITDLLTPNSSAPLTSFNYPAKPDGSLTPKVYLPRDWDLFVVAMRHKGVIAPDKAAELLAECQQFRAGMDF